MRPQTFIFALALAGASTAQAARADQQAIDVPAAALERYRTDADPAGLVGLATSAPAQAAAIFAPERPAAGTDGSVYSQIAPIFTGTDGNVSFIRLANGNGLLGTTAKTITATVMVVGSPSGKVYGTTQVQVPSLQNPQYAVTDLLSQANAGALTGGDTAYAVYLSSSDKQVQFQHVIWNQGTTFFENMSICDNHIAGAVNATGNSAALLLNVYTTAVPAYPSKIFFHNYQNAAVTYQLSVFDTKTGASLGTLNLPLAANASYFVPESTFEQELNWTPSGSQFNVMMALSVSGASTATVAATAGQFIFNQGLQSYVNMSLSCNAH